MPDVLVGLFWIYGPIAVLAGFLWLSPWFVRRLVALWVGRDVMLGFIPKPEHVHMTEKLLGIRTRNTRDRT